MKPILEHLLMNSEMYNIIVTLLMMIAEDIKSIMKIIKGILIKFELNKKVDKVKPIIISTTTNLCSIEYVINESILHIILNLEMSNNLNKSSEKSN